MCHRCRCCSKHEKGSVIPSLMKTLHGKDVAIFTAQQQQHSLHGPDVGTSGGRSGVVSERQLSCLSTKNLMLKMGGWGGVPAVVVVVVVVDRPFPSKRHHEGHTAEVSGWWGAAARRWTGGSHGSAQPGRRRGVLGGEETQSQTTVRAFCGCSSASTFLRSFRIFASNQTAWSRQRKTPLERTREGEFFYFSVTMSAAYHLWGCAHVGLLWFPRISGFHVS